MGVFKVRSACRWAILAELAVCLGSSAAAQQPVQTGRPEPAKVTLVEPPAPLLPTNDKLVARDGAGPEEKPETQAILKEDGLARKETRALVAGDHDAGWVAAYQFGDATGAFAAYTYFRQAGRPVSGERVNPSEVVLPGGEVVYVNGVTVVRADVKGGESVGKVLAGVEPGLPKVSGRRGLSPLLPTLVPRDGLESASLRYSLGPVSYQSMGGQLPPAVMGWDKAAEVATAIYSGRQGKGVLTLLIYPTPQIAAEKGRALEQAVNAAGPNSLGTVTMRRIGPLIGVTTGGLALVQAKGLMDKLHLNQEVTFDQKMPLVFHTEIKKTASLLENIAVLCGVLVLAALLLGVFLGGARAGIRVLMGKSAASEPEFLTISLREQPKGLFGPGGSPGEPPAV